MDTHEARVQMRDAAREALEIIARLSTGVGASPQDGESLRRLLRQSRSLLADAGYPGEAIWRGLQRATIGLETQFETSDPLYWQNVSDELRAGIETLDALVAPAWRPDSDVHIVG